CVIPHVERTRRTCTDSNAERRDEGQDRVQQTGRKDLANERRKDDERHHARLKQRQEITGRRLGKAGGVIQHLLPLCHGHVAFHFLVNLMRPGSDPGRSFLGNRADYLMRGSSSHWWNGGGDDSCHSSVVAPSPHGFAPATRFLAKASNTPYRKT